MSLIPHKREKTVTKNYHYFGILGAGAWGTALAQAAALAGRDVILWTRHKEFADTLRTKRENTSYLPGIKLDDRIQITENMADLTHADAICSVVPTQKTREVLSLFSPHASDGQVVLLCSKGLEQGSMKFMHQVLQETLPKACPSVLSGPGFASDVAHGRPTAITLACNSQETGQALSYALGRPEFRPYWTDDLLGAEIGGSVKNVLALACGVCDGLGLGESARAALITRGFAELTRFGLAMGARRETLTGLCGLGDLVLTCSSLKSRNFSYGYALGQKKKYETGVRGKLAEGVSTAPALADLAQKLNIDMPLVKAVCAILAHKATPLEAMDKLLKRPFRPENM